MFNRLELNLTELCNLKCTFCPRAFDYPNLNKHMSLDTAELIADQVAMLPFTPDVIFSGRCEPTLHEKFGELAELFLERDLNIILFTNGKRLDRYMDIIDRFKRLSYDVYSNDIEDYHAAIEQTNHMKVDRQISQKSDDGIFLRKWSKGVSKELQKSFVDNRAGSISNQPFHMGKRCTWLDSVVFIDWNGDYNLCCQDWTPTVMGNVYKESLFDYFQYNKNLKAYQEGIKSGNRLSPCDVCTYSLG